MFQRFKNVLDSLDSEIAEEQARQRSQPSQASAARRRQQGPSSPKRSSARSPAQRAAGNTRRGAASDGTGSPSRQPNPDTFDTDFVIGDDTPSRGSTPNPAGEPQQEAEANPDEAQEKAREDGDRQTDRDKAKGGGGDKDRSSPQDGFTKASGDSKDGPSAPTATEPKSPYSTDLPTEVRIKLRKLERIESRHADLVRSYRIAHARVATIEDFEATLREHTSLTSIADPGALIEYLDQINSKSNLLVDELRRITTEKDSLKKQLDQAEVKIQTLEADKEKRAIEGSVADSNDTTIVTPEAESVLISQDTAAVKPAAPKSLSPDDSEEFFSYDTELERLQSDIEDRDSKIVNLETQNKKLISDIEVAKESAEHMARDLELATRETEAIAEAKSKVEAEFNEKFSSLERNSSNLQGLVDDAQARMDAQQFDASQKLESLERQLKQAIDAIPKEPSSDAAAAAVSPDGFESKQETPTARSSSPQQAKGESSQTSEPKQTESDAQEPAARAASEANEIEKLKRKLKDQEALNEEIESLREDLINLGGDHVESKERVKELQAEKEGLQESLEKLEKGISELRAAKVSNSDDSEEQENKLANDFQELESKVSSLQTDLSAAQHLAASRYKDLTDARNKIQKAQTELLSLRKEAESLRGSKAELQQKTTELRKLESREKDLKAEVTALKSNATDKDKEVRGLNERVNQALNQRLNLEESTRKAQRDAQRFETERDQAVTAKDKLSQELGKLQGEHKISKERADELQGKVTQLSTDANALRDELSLKSAQYVSAQSLMNSMQDQTQELGAQMKEVRERCDSLEEELADAHRLLSERGRESETMRRLLSDVESRAELRVKEMRERVELATEERDRAEDQANTVGRRRTRELEELRHQLKDAEKALKRALEEKEDFTSVEGNLRTQKEELESRSASTAEELAEVRQAMTQLREALDDGERQATDLEQEKADISKTLEETRSKLAKVQESSKKMAEELRAMQSPKPIAVTTSESKAEESGRSSMDSTASPLPQVANLNAKLRAIAEAAPRHGSGQLDYVYLKNVLLQFLEQKDKKHQIQLVPVLGMLLHFDRKDEQKWMAAITAK